MINDFYIHAYNEKKPHCTKFYYYTIRYTNTIGRVYVMLYLTLQSKAYIQHSPKLNKALSAPPTTSTNTYGSKAKCVKKDEKI